MKKPRRYFLVIPSTLEFYRQASKTPEYRLADFLHGYIYARWTYLYISIGAGEHRLAKTLGPWIAAISRILPAS